MRLTREVFSQKTGIGVSTVKKWETRGAVHKLSLRLAEVMDATLDGAEDDAAERFWQGRMCSASVGSLLPPLESGLIQRADEFHELRALVLAAADHSSPQVIAVAGPGGFGKTTLTAQVTHDPEVAAAFEDILWVETGQSCTPDRVVQLISDLCVHLGHDRPALADPTQAGLHLARLLDEREALLIIDNVWSAHDLAPFLQGAPRCVRMISTRNVGVCPSDAAVFRLGTMNADETKELIRRNLPSEAIDGLSPLATLCGGWPLLATVVNAAVGHDIRSGATLGAALAAASEMLQADGPGAFDVWDTDQRSTAIGHAISASLRNLVEHVTIPGAARLDDRYLDLCVFPASIPIPIPILAQWWKTAHGWSVSSTRRFCRVLADRSMISAHLAGQDAIVLHDVFVAYLRHLCGDGQQAIHRSLLDAFRPVSLRWVDAQDVDYLWRWLSYHLDRAALLDELYATFGSLDFLADKVHRYGHQSLALDYQILSSHPSSSPGRELTAAGFLLHGLTDRTDILATLRVITARTGHELACAPSDSGFDVEHVVSSDNHSPGHIGAVVSVSVNGSTLASGGEDGVLKLWDLATGSPVRRCSGHTGWIHATAVAPDGSVVATGGDDADIRLWDTESGSVIAVLAGHTRRVRSLVFTHDGTRLVSGSEDCHISVWDVEHRTMVRAPTVVAVPVWSVAVSLDDQLIAVGGQDESVRLIDLADGRITAEKIGHDDWVRTVAFADQRTLLSGSGDRSIRRWTITPDHDLIPETRATFTERVRAIVSDNDQTVVATEDAHLHIFEDDRQVADAAMPPGVDWIRSIAITEAGEVIAGCEDGAIRRLRGGLVSTWVPGVNTVWSIAHHPQTRQTLLGDGTGEITITDESGTKCATMQVSPGRIWSLACAANYIAAACGDGQVHLRSTTDPAWSLVLNHEARRTWAVTIAGSGTRVAASARDGLVRVWSLPAGDLIWETRTAAGRIRSLSFDDEGSILAAACGDGTARLWNSHGELLTVVPAAGGWSRTVALDPAGSRLAVGAGTGTIIVRDTGTGETVAELSGHAGRVLMLGFLDDHVVSVAANGTARWWSLTESRHCEVRVDASCQAAAFEPARGRVTIASAGGMTTLTVPQSAMGA
ncbi:NB-ARC domain-containing protein [Nocardia sp. NPDC003979]